MAGPGALTSFSPNTLIKSADVNSNFTTLRNSLLTAGFTDTANTWTLAQTFSGGISVSGTATFTSGVTFTSGTTVTASGVTIAGGVTFSGAVTVSGAVSFQNTVTLTTVLTAGGGSIAATSTLTTVAFALNTTQDTGLSGSAGVVNIAASATKILQGTSNICTIGPTINFQTNNGGGLATNATAGFICIPVGTATQTGTPNILTGNAALVYDTVHDHLQIYNPGSGTWKSATFA